MKAAERITAALRDGHKYGYDIGKAARVRPGRMYPILARMERDGTVRSCWDAGVPRRRVYRLAAPVLRAVGDAGELGQGLDAVRAVRERLKADDGESA